MNRREMFGAMIGAFAMAVVPAPVMACLTKRRSRFIDMTKINRITQVTPDVYRLILADKTQVYVRGKAGQIYGKMMACTENGGVYAPFEVVEDSDVQWDGRFLSDTICELNPHKGSHMWPATPGVTFDLYH